MKFSQFLNEDEGAGDIGSINSVGTFVNSSDNTDNYDAPIGLMKRIDMPQVDSNLYMDFIADLDNKNITCQHGTHACADLLPTQEEFNEDKVESIRNEIRQGGYVYSPILITRHNEIVDGHHRWKAFDKYDKIKTFKVDMTFDQLHEFLLNKPYTYRKTISQ